MNIVKAIAENGLAKSCSEARRYIVMKAVKVNGVLIDDLMADIKAGDELRIGRTSKLAIAPRSKRDEGKTLGGSTPPPSA